MNFSRLRWVPLPSPAKAKLIAPGLALASERKLAKDLKPEVGCTTSTLGAPVSRVMSTKSFRVSYGNLAYMDGFTACAEELMISV
ncbi:hypothetical protein D3C83_49800 [compost metagenome]